jgi:hypothetical protein
LAACSLAPPKYTGPLQDTNFLSPAQKSANNLNVKVTACTRALTFDEVGKGTAFARVASAMILVPSNYDAKVSFGTFVTDVTIKMKLWQEFRKQSDLEAVIDGISNL